MIIDGDHSDEEGPQKLKLKPGCMEGNLYKEGLTSVHGITCEPNGKVKLLVDAFVARRWRCQEERHGTICIHFTWTHGKKRARKGGAGAPKYLLLGEDSFVTRTACIGPLGVICV